MERWIPIGGATVLLFATAVPSAAEDIVGFANQADHSINLPSDPNYPVRTSAASLDGRTFLTPQYMDGRYSVPTIWPELANPTTLSDPVLGLDLLPPYAISGDGHTVVGGLPRIPPWDYQVEAALWRDSGEFVRLGHPPEDCADCYPFYYGSAYAVSRDGSVIVGYADQRATIWTEATGMQLLPVAHPSGPRFQPSFASAISGDGDIVGGQVSGNAFIWTLAQGTTILGSGYLSNAHAITVWAISDDGSTVVGTGRFDGVDQAFVWTEAEGLIGLMDKDTRVGFEGKPLAVSADGRVVVGFYTHLLFGLPTAFLWTREEGSRDLAEVIESAGVSTEDWYAFDQAWGISSDGTTVLGTGRRFGAPRAETFSASLRVATTGVGLCSLGAPGCLPFEIIGRTGFLAPNPRYYGDRFAGFRRPMLNENGEVLVEADGQSGVLLIGPDEEGKPVRRVSEYDPAPGLGDDDARFRFFNLASPERTFADPVMNAAGDILFFSNAQADGILTGDERSLWRSRRGSETPELVAETGAAVPGDPVGTYDQFCGWFQIDAAGGAAFHGVESDLCGPLRSGSKVVVPGKTGDPELLLAQGDPAPGLGPDVRFHSAYLHWLNDRGEPALWGYLEGEGVDESNDTAIWATAGNGELALVMREGDPVPGYPAGTTYTRGSFYDGEHFAYNDRGELAFPMNLSGPGITELNSVGYWKWNRSGQLKHVLQVREQVPGEPPGTEFRMLGELVMNNAGGLAFLGTLYSPEQSPASQYGYWKLSRRGELRSLLRQGQAAPHLPAGVTLESPVTQFRFTRLAGLHDSNLGDPVMNDAGSTLLDFYLEGVGVDESNDQALYLVDAAGNPILVLREGDALEVAYDDVRTVTQYFVDSGFRSSMGRSAIDRHGNVAARVDFDDGSHAVVKFNVPEPRFGAGVALGCLFGALLLRHRCPSRT